MKVGISQRRNYLIINTFWVIVVGLLDSNTTWA
jgi:hypothetical protein